MTKIYIVTSGAYSDYGIECVFSSKEEAQRICDLNKNHPHKEIMSDWRIEEWELDFFKDAKWCRVWFANMRQDGTVSVVSDWRFGQERNLQRAVTQRENKGKTIWAHAASIKSEDHAKKLCVEAYQKELRKNV